MFHEEGTSQKRSVTQLSGAGEEQARGPLVTSEPAVEASQTGFELSVPQTGFELALLLP